LAKLGKWDEALEKYNERLVKNPDDINSIRGKLKCLDAMGHWELATKLCTTKLKVLMGHTTDPEQSREYSKFAVIGARAAWSLGEWDIVEQLLSDLAVDNVDASLMRAGG
jgi:FKBP12-rapamycin complex-associated protein